MATVEPVGLHASTEGYIAKWLLIMHTLCAPCSEDIVVMAMIKCIYWENDCNGRFLTVSFFCIVMKTLPCTYEYSDPWSWM